MTNPKHVDTIRRLKAWKEARAPDPYKHVMEYGDDPPDRHQLRRMRLEAGMTQQELSLQLGLYIDTVCRWENGKNLNITSENRIRYAIHSYHIGVRPHGRTIPKRSKHARATPRRHIQHTE